MEGPSPPANIRSPRPAAAIANDKEDTTDRREPDVISRALGLRPDCVAANASAVRRPPPPIFAGYAAGRNAGWSRRLVSARMSRSLRPRDPTRIDSIFTMSNSAPAFAEASAGK